MYVFFHIYIHICLFLFHDIQSVPIISNTIPTILYPHPNWSLSNPFFLKPRNCRNCTNYNNSSWNPGQKATRPQLCSAEKNCRNYFWNSKNRLDEVNHTKGYWNQQNSVFDRLENSDLDSVFPFWVWWILVSSISSFFGFDSTWAIQFLTAGAGIVSWKDAGKPNDGDFGSMQCSENWRVYYPAMETLVAVGKVLNIQASWDTIGMSWGYCWNGIRDLWTCPCMGLAPNSRPQDGETIFAQRWNGVYMLSENKHLKPIHLKSELAHVESNHGYIFDIWCDCIFHGLRPGAASFGRSFVWDHNTS